MEVKKSFYTAATHHFDLTQVEHVACDLCGGAGYREIGIELGFSIRTCTACGLVYVSPQPAVEEYSRFYEGMYAGDPEAEARERSLGYVERHLSRLLARKRPRGGTLLEIGCGHGELMRALANQPWQRTGLELSENALAYAREHTPGATFFQGSIEDADFSGNPQDCIVMVAVLEHVRSPRETLGRLMTWLNPGGLLLVQVPYVAPFIRLKRWVPGLPIHFEAPRHLYDFSPGILRRYLSDTGYENIELRISVPYSSPSRLGAAMIWSVKGVGYLIQTLSGGRYIYPFASALLGCAERP